MDRVSDVVVQPNKHEQISHMVQAMQGWETAMAESMATPSGQFGRVVKIQTGTLTVDNNLDLEFEVPFDDDTEANEATVKIYNLTKQTIGLFAVNKEITITAGYAADTGLIFSGVISSVSTKWSGRDKVTTITAIDSPDLKERDVESIAFAKGTKASYILKTLVSKLGLPVAVFSVKKDYTYTEAQTVSGGLMSAIRDYAEVCGVSAYINKRKVYVRHLSEGDNLGFSVNVDTGLLDSPEEFMEETEDKTASTDKNKVTKITKGVKFKMLLEHRVTTAGIIELKSREYSGKYRVREGKHVCTESDFYTEVTAIQ